MELNDMNSKVKTMSEWEVDEDMDELSSAEDFLNYFEIEYDSTVVHVNRLHILQRFHDYMAQSAQMLPDEEESRRAVYKVLLERAYQDFVSSDALTEKVFKVFKTHGADQGFVPLDSLLK